MFSALIANELVGSVPVVGANLAQSVVPVVPGPVIDFTILTDQCQTNFGAALCCAGVSKLRDIFCTSVYYNDEVFKNTR